MRRLVLGVRLRECGCLGWLKRLKYQIDHTRVNVKVLPRKGNLLKEKVLRFNSASSMLGFEGWEVLTEETKVPDRSYACQAERFFQERGISGRRKC